ncbi:unnamed protein product [Brachionus calyciflorus]|uniref:Uncharacterized protein n=1 Tax=Brachionus calyciflorus TaxID=104777 RepID=A0A814HTR0_9BILA|nr:unnamed protein product [Brachionus calyciflorus]
MNKFLKIFFGTLIIQISFIYLFYKLNILNIYFHYNGSDNFVQNEKKIVRYKCVTSYCGGLSDRMRSIVSAWALAKLTDRRYDIIELYKFNAILIPLLAVNPIFKQKLIELGFSPRNFTYQILVKKAYNDLFKLSPSLQILNDNFLKDARPSNETKLISAQVRIGGARPNVPHDANFMSKDDSILFWNFINQTFINKMNFINSSF